MYYPYTMDGLESNFSRPDKYKMPPLGAEAVPQVHTETENREIQDPVFRSHVRSFFVRLVQTEYLKDDPRERDSSLDFVDRKIDQMLGGNTKHFQTSSYLERSLSPKEESTLGSFFERAQKMAREEVETERRRWNGEQ